jgi:hypothetical protein
VLELDDGTCICVSWRFFRGAPSQSCAAWVPKTERSSICGTGWSSPHSGRSLTHFRQCHEFFKGRIRQVPEDADAQRLNAEDGLAWLNQELANRPFAGNTFSIADITAMVEIDFGNSVKNRNQT